MIKNIGAKRVLVILVLVAILVVSVLASYFVFEPQNEQVQQTLNKTMSEKTTLQSEVDKMRADFATFEQEKTFFDTISKMGFFNDQDRVLARERFDTMQKLSKIISAHYEIKAANIIAEDGASATDFVVMESPISVDLSAIDDLDVYRFIYYLNYGFPGHITINSLTMERKAEVTPTILKEIGTGSPPEIINAKMELQWRTMARKESIAPQTIAPTPSAAAQGQPQ